MEKPNTHIGMGLLAFPVDIDAVLQHLLQDMRDDWFVDPIQHRDLFANKVQLRHVLHELLLEGNGQYRGAQRCIYDIPKKGLGIRYSLETDFYDRFIYQAICSFLIPYYDPLLSHRVLGHRYNKDRTSERYLKMHEIICPHCSKAFKTTRRGMPTSSSRRATASLRSSCTRASSRPSGQSARRMVPFVTKSRWPVAFGVGTPTTGPRWRVWPEGICDGRAEVADFGMFCVFCFFTEN